MDIRYAILGFLGWKSFSGYDLKKMIARSDLFYWSGNNNQIYTALIQMNKDGLVDQTVELQENLPAKKNYSITKKGREEFKRWMSTRPEMPEIHDHFLIQLAWAEGLTDSEMDELMACYEEDIAIQFKMAEEQSTREVDRPGRTAREKFIWKKIDENLAGVYQRELEWVQKLRRQIKEKIYEKDETEV